MLEYKHVTYYNEEKSSSQTTPIFIVSLEELLDLKMGTHKINKKIGKLYKLLA
jgi:hypothetical protein